MAKKFFTLLFFGVAFPAVGAERIVFEADVRSYNNATVRQFAVASTSKHPQDLITWAKTKHYDCCAQREGQCYTVVEKAQGTRRLSELYRRDSCD